MKSNRATWPDLFKCEFSWPGSRTIIRNVCRSYKGSVTKPESIRCSEASVLLSAHFIF